MASPPSGLCEEKTRLLRVYSFATADYSRAVMVLHERSGKMSKHDYQEIHDFAEKARTVVDEARAALNEHTIIHGC